MGWVVAFITTFALLAVAQAERSPLQSTTSNAGAGAYRNCKPPIPAMNNMREDEFQGLWYLDSTSLYSWTTSTCHAMNFTWHPMKFVHDNKHYEGYFRYYVRIDYNRQKQCWVQCSFSLNGYLHGYEHWTSASYCNFGSDNTNVTVAARQFQNSDQDPCHPHYPIHSDYWVLKTDYKQGYAVLFFCENGHKLMMLMSRSKKSLARSIREEVAYFLKEHGYNTRLMPVNNDYC